MNEPRRGARRMLVAMTALALVLAACSGDKNEVVGGGDPSTSTTSAGGASTASGPNATASTAPHRGGSGGTTGANGGGTMGTSGTTTTAGNASAVIGVGTTDLGWVAPALLRPGRGDRVVLEVRAQAGATPTSGTINHLVSVLRSASGKQVSVDGTDALPGGSQEWSQRKIIDAAAAAAQTESGRSQVVLRLLFLRGTYEGDASVLGVAVAGDVAAVFSDQVDSAAGILVSPADVEDAVAMHEVGHLLALVDLIVGSGRGDPDHPNHSRNSRSVMYWKVESDVIVQLLDGGIPRDFDDDDRAELAQIRAG